MGAAASTSASASSSAVLGGHEELLDSFVGPTSVPVHDGFWDRLLSFSYALPKMKPEDFDEATREACTTLALNNRHTFHFGKLLVHLMRSLDAVQDNTGELPLRAINTVYFTRLFVKHLVEYYDNKEIWEHLILNLSPDEAKHMGMSAGRQDLVVAVVRALLSFVAQRAVTVHTYLLHLEVVNLLLVMMSTQLHGSHTVVSSEPQIFLQAAMAQEDLAAPFVQKLLLNFIARLPLPPKVPFYIPTLTGRQGVLRRVGSAAVTVFLLPYYTYSFLMNPSFSSSPDVGKAPLADNSLLLLLVLVHYGRLIAPSIPFFLSRDSTQSSSSSGAMHKELRGGEPAYPDTSCSRDSEEGQVSQREASLSGAVEHDDGSDGGAMARPPQYHPNPFKRAISTACDSSMALGAGPPSVSDAERGDGDAGGTVAVANSSSGGGNGERGGIVRVPFAALYDSLGSSLTGDTATLLLYSLVHGNSSFLDYCLVRSDLDTMLIPLLEMLYNAPRRTANQIYMLLIILLILSQDASFNANVHKLVLPSVPWYKERLLTRISLGSLMVIILIRTVKYNLSKLKDVYLHTNCLATLANMAPHAHHLNAYASQRLVSLFHMLARRYTKLSKADSGSQIPSTDKLLQGDAAGRPASDAAATDDSRASREYDSSGSVALTVVVDNDASAAEHQPLIDGEGGSDAPTEIHIYTDFLRIVLEIINAILTYALPRNPEVVYALLHRQELFVPFRNHPRFYELLENIFTVIEFFNVRMDDRLEVDTGDWSVEKVLQIVVANARTWRGEGMQTFTELKFTYEEEVHPEEFFVPYVWTLVVAHSGIPWNADCITMFPVRPTAEHLEDVYDADAFDTHSELGRTPREEV